MTGHETPIAIDTVSYAYDSVVALDHVTLNIKSGEYTAIIGPNGAGKTTLLKVMLGLLKPQSGSVRIMGQSLESFNQKYLLGYVPQRVSASAIQFPATVYEVVESGCTARLGLFHTIDQNSRDKIHWAMDIAQISHLRDNSIAQLSGGQLQRVYIARALAGAPQLLFLDEPAVGVDLQTQERFYQFLQQLNEKLKLTIVIVTHEIDVAVHRAHSVICLNRKLVCHTASTQLMHSDYLQQLYSDHAHFVKHDRHHHHA